MQVTGMPMTLVQKVLARASGKKSVAIGEVVVAEPDLYQLIDLEMPHFCDTLEAEGIDKVRFPDRCIVFADHEVPTQTVEVANQLKKLRSQLQSLGIRHHYVQGRHGISHQAIVEKGHVRPGMLVIGPDTHITTLGCVGAIGIPVNYETVQALVTGDIWLRVPETIRISLSGKLRPGVMSRDVAQRIAGQLTREKADYRVIEFRAPMLDMDARMTLCNVMVDIGAKSAVVEVDDVTKAYLEARVGPGIETIRSDEGAEFHEEIHVDLSKMEPMIAAPPRPDNIVPVSSVAGRKVDQVYIGSCAGGRIEDLRAAHGVLKGRSVHPDVRMYVIPTTQEVYAAAGREGLLEAFATAGAVVMTPNCGPCYGGLAPLADGDVCIGTGTSNVPGRMGSKDAEIFLSNAVVATAAAIAGKIVDPFTLEQ
jgi:3-isopropylmalate/(R)-2-methylmalate dehydratase large subunit